MCELRAELGLDLGPGTDVGGSSLVLSESARELFEV
jgi:hypothetical protein